MTQEKQIQQLEKNLEDRKWRINNLYWIKDKNGKRVKFKMNWVQRYLFDNLWYLNIILKARQLGISTFICILFLDDVLFNSKDAGIIAHTLQDAQRLFDTKVLYAWNNLNPFLQKQFQVDAKNTRMLKFTRNGKSSSIYIGVSSRSGTVQRLHISELSTIDQKYPDKAKEVRTGALNTVQKDQMVIIESTAKGRQGIFADMAQESLKLQREGVDLTSMDYKFFFFPWFFDPSYKIDDPVIIPREVNDLLDEVEKTTGIKLTRAQRAWYYKKRLNQRDQMKSEYPSTPEEAFAASIEGSYYGKQMDLLRERHKITTVEYDPSLLADTWWDIGIGDTMCIVFTQTYGMQIRIMDYYENSGEGMAHYAKVLNEKNYAYGTHNAPHDIEVREIGTGKSRLETSRELGIQFNVVEKLSIADGVEAVRNTLPFCWFDKEKTDTLVKALEEYRKEWDDDLGCWKDKPLHNWASHPADAFRMLGVGHQRVHPLGAEIVDPEIQEMEDLKRIEELNKNINPFAL